MKLFAIIYPHESGDEHGYHLATEGALSDAICRAGCHEVRVRYFQTLNTQIKIYVRWDAEYGEFRVCRRSEHPNHIWILDDYGNFSCYDFEDYQETLDDTNVCTLAALSPLKHLLR